MNNPKNKAVSIRANKANAPFVIGDSVVQLANPEREPQTITWVSKNATRRGDQLISTNNQGHYSDAWIFLKSGLESGYVWVYADREEGFRSLEVAG